MDRLLVGSLQRAPEAAEELRLLLLPGPSRRVLQGLQSLAHDPVGDFVVPGAVPDPDSALVVVRLALDRGLEPFPGGEIVVDEPAEGGNLEARAPQGTGHRRLGAPLPGEQPLLLRGQRRDHGGQLAGRGPVDQVREGGAQDGRRQEDLPLRLQDLQDRAQLLAVLGGEAVRRRGLRIELVGELGQKEEQLAQPVGAQADLVGVDRRGVPEGAPLELGDQAQGDQPADERPARPGVVLLLAEPHEQLDFLGAGQCPQLHRDEPPRLGEPGRHPVEHAFGERGGAREGVLEIGHVAVFVQLEAAARDRRGLGDRAVFLFEEGFARALGGTHIRAPLSGGRCRTPARRTRRRTSSPRSRGTGWCSPRGPRCSGPSCRSSRPRTGCPTPRRWASRRR